jgi:DedD protein
VLESSDLAPHAQDDGFHEIQLNGKQLVFVFMAATVVSVVIFLCGVLVGRGVRTERGTTSLVDATQSAVSTTGEARPDLASPVRPPTVVRPGDDPTKAPPPAPPSTDGESNTEAPRAAAPPAAGKSPTAGAATKPVPVPANVPATKPVDAASVSPKTTPETASESAKPGPTTDSPAADIPAADDPRQGWVVQVAATKTRGEADTMAKRLTAKGYSAFVLSNSADVFRVRVGGYKSRRDAETVAARLRKEERVNPWVTH